MAESLWRRRGCGVGVGVRREPATAGPVQLFPAVILLLRPGAPRHGAVPARGSRDSPLAPGPGDR